MQEIKTFALCVRAEDYGESSKILTLITTDYGKIVAQIRSVKSPKSKLKQCASPFCLGEYILTKGKSGRYVVTGAGVEESFFSLWTDVRKNSSASIVAEALDRLTYEGVGAKDELVRAVKAIAAIDSAPSDPYVYAVHFLMSMLPSEGIDLSDFDFPKAVGAAIGAISACDVDELETLDITESALISALTYVNLIYRNKLGERLNSVSEALKLLSASC